MQAGKPSVIGLTGHMGAGKDSAAALLAMVGYQRVAFADQVRHEAAEAIARGFVPTEALAYPQIAYDLQSVTTEEVWEKPTKNRMRRILQWWGTEYRRASDPDYWVKRAMQEADAIPMMAVSDVRFPNEVAAIRERGGVVWKINRSVTLNGIPGHASETLVDQIEPDVTISNHGTLLDLADAIMSQLSQCQVADATGTP